MKLGKIDHMNICIQICICKSACKKHYKLNQYSIKIYITVVDLSKFCYSIKCHSNIYRRSPLFHCNIIYELECVVGTVYH